MKLFIKPFAILFLLSNLKLHFQKNLLLSSIKELNNKVDKLQCRYNDLNTKKNSICNIYSDLTTINNTILKRNNYLTLNRGRIHGIRKNMGVICGDGIVGIVKDVSDHYCSVISFLHKDARISAQLNSSKDFGSLVWDGLNPKIASLRDIPTHVKVKIGDSITTTGFSSIFPENVMVGKVNSVSQKNGDNFFEVSINLSTNFSTLRYVYVVSDILADEKVKIEK